MASVPDHRRGAGRSQQPPERRHTGPGRAGRYGGALAGNLARQRATWRAARQASVSASRWIKVQPEWAQTPPHDHEQALDQGSHVSDPGAEWPIRGEAWTAKHDRGGVPNGGSARAYLADSSRRQRSNHHGRPRHDCERGLHIYAGHALLKRSHMPDRARASSGGSSERQPGRSSTASTGLSPDDGLQSSHAHRDCGRHRAPPMGRHHAG